MTKKELEQLETNLTNEVNRRAGLGGYGADAESLLFLSSAILQIVRHLRTKAKK